MTDPTNPFAPRGAALDWKAAWYALDQDSRALRDRIAALEAERDGLQAAIKRQAGAAKTLRQCTLDEVRHLREKDRANYIAPTLIEGEREANALLSSEIERLEAACATWAEVSQTNYQRAKTAEARAEELDALLNRAAKALVSVKEEDGDGFVMGSDWHDETRAILALIAKDTARG